MAVLVFSGKGGTGKTTLAALTVRYFYEKGKVSLTLDMDPDAHLFKLLEVPLEQTVGNIVDRVHKEKNFELEPRKPVDVSDAEYFYSLVMRDVLIESEGFDLITLGKPSSEIDCYCPVFYWADLAISKILRSYKMPYDHIVVDCDPGTEIFPRRILDTIAEKVGIDYVFIIIDGSRMSLDTAIEIRKEIKKKEGLRFGEVLGLCNRIDDPKMQAIIKEFAASEYGINIAGFVRSDIGIIEGALKGEGILKKTGLRAFEDLKKILQSLGL
ncbi:AAA family ATPase [Candidatus Bathyarchaeota archaeon]|nr:AAA family ATPase [Candidatus Bathyarchaeota archaeon]